MKEIVPRGLHRSYLKRSSSTFWQHDVLLTKNQTKGNSATPHGVQYIYCIQNEEHRLTGPSTALQPSPTVHAIYNFEDAADAWDHRPKMSVYRHGRYRALMSQHRIGDWESIGCIPARAEQVSTQFQSGFISYRRATIILSHQLAKLTPHSQLANRRIPMKLPAPLQDP